jgi:hypothetical protein
MCHVLHVPYGLKPQLTLSITAAAATAAAVVHVHFVIELPSGEPHYSS